MDKVIDWAIDEFQKNNVGVYMDDELRQMFENLSTEDSTTINRDLTSLMDI